MKAKQMRKSTHMNVKLFLMLFMTAFCLLLFGGAPSNNVVVEAAVTQTETLSWLNAVAGNGKVQLTWNAVTGAKKYVVYMKRTSGEVVPVDSGVKTNRYTVSGLTNGIDVGFIPKAYAAGKWSAWSNTVWVTPIAPEEMISPRITYVDDNVVISQGIYGNGYLYVPESEGAQETYNWLVQTLCQYSKGVTTNVILTRDEMLWIAGQLIQMQGVTRIELEEVTRYPSCSEHKVSMRASPAFIYLYAWKNSDTSVLNEEEKLALAKAVELVKEAERFTTDYEKEVFFHDYLVLNIEYNSEDSSNSGQTPYGTLILQKCVCAGYASTFQLLLNMSGIDAMYVTGTGNGGAHAWNKVELDGEWFNVDVTCDDPLPDRPGKVRYRYLNVTDEYLEQDHSWKNEGLPECTSTTDNYILKTFKVCKIQSEANAYCAEQLALGNNTVTFLFADGECSVNDIANTVYGGCSWSYDDVMGGRYYEITFN